jgi:intracellular septation protein
MTAPEQGRTLPSHLRTAIDFVPLLVFFGANYVWGILPATAVLVAATAVATLVLWLAERRIPPIPVATAVLVGFFGALTLVFDDAFFIKIKPTVVSLLFAVVLAGGLARGKLLVKYLFGAAGIQLRDAAWRVLTWRWIGFFVLLAVLNEVVWRSFSTDTWVSYKVFGILPLTLLFAGLQMPLILREQKALSASGDAPN